MSPAGTALRAVVVGGGVVGCACALALARRGVAVTVLERGVAGAEAPGETGAATWAAAGILGAQIATREHDALARLCVASRALYPAFVAGLVELTGIDVELRPSGILKPAFSEAELASFAGECAWQPAAGLGVETLDARAALAAEPSLAPDVVGAIAFPDDARIDPPTLLRALRVGVARAGGRLRAGSEVRRVVERAGRATGVELTNGEELDADAVILAAGSWSSGIGTPSTRAPAVVPARGQMVELVTDRPLFGAVLEGADAYLSPRDDGRVLVGSTVELVGHRRGTTAAAVRALLGGALRMVPALADASVTRAWSGFRPFIAGAAGVPTIGADELPGLFFATGHHRNGVLLAPITAERVARLVLGEVEWGAGEGGVRGPGR